jgi:FSR family fosmidomycin resistance protein-like MFS transporter
MSASQAGWAIAVWTGVGLVGDLLLIPLLERVNGITYLRFSVVVQLVLYPAFLLVPGLQPKLIILGLMGLFNAGWYAILQGRLYTAMPGKSGTVMALSSVTGLVGSLLPLAIGVIATQHGLQTALWVLFLGPVVLFFGLPRR